MADDAFSKSIDDVHRSGKINGLMQAQVIALEHANRYRFGSVSYQVAQRIAAEIESARAALEDSPNQAVTPGHNGGSEQDG